MDEASRNEQSYWAGYDRREIDVKGTGYVSGRQWWVYVPVVVDISYHFRITCTHRTLQASFYE
jgi:hypothetical protein